MTLASIWAFLSVLAAFGVSQPTIDQIQGILLPTASTTQVAYVPVTTTPITENQPIYFGSVAPVQPMNNVPKTMVQSIPMDNSSIVLKDITLISEYMRPTPLTHNYSFEVRDTDGNIVRNNAPFSILVDGAVYDTQNLNSLALDKDRNVKYGKVFPVDLLNPNAVVSVEYNGVNYLPQ